MGTRRKSTDQHYDEMISWWVKLANKNDCEGDLVLGLLMFFDKLIPEYDGKNIYSRLQAASVGGFPIADYILNEKLTASD
ncbi:MAG: hypothetical protein FWE27_09935 [Defluviitaleaceae bacterium]|nr:hypothetical protein [Defluviitaleaceae bacterium]